ncbi:MAG: phospholipase [Flavobacteriales bacterium]|nr:phospholipase [Flavobacteriales bacterium]
MEERHIRVPRTARYHVLGDVAKASEIWVVVHGYGQLARYFLNHFKGLEEHRCIVAPEGLSRFYLDEAHTRVGATWMTREDRLHEIEDHVAYLDALVEQLRSQARPDASIHALGFSQGVATVARWSVQGRTGLRQLVLWAGGIPPELDREALAKWRGLRIDLVLGDQDEYASAKDLDAQAVRLEQAGVHCCKHLFEGGHKLEPVTLRRVMGAD